MQEAETACAKALWQEGILHLSWHGGAGVAWADGERRDQAGKWWEPGHTGPAGLHRIMVFICITAGGSRLRRREPEEDWLAVGRRQVPSIEAEITEGGVYRPGGCGVGGL